MNLLFRSPLARKSITDVTRRKGRTFIVVLSIFIGVLGLTGINVFSFKITDAYGHQLDPSHYPDLVISVNQFDPTLTTQIARLPNVQAVQERMTGRFQWQAAGGPVAMNIIAYQDLQHPRLGGFDLTGGHYPGPGEIVMEMTDLSLRSFSLDQTMYVQGPKGRTPLHIVGLAQTSGLPRISDSNVALGYVRMSDLGRLLGRTTVNSIAIKVRDVNAVPATAQALRQLLQEQFPRAQSTVTISLDHPSIAFILGFIAGFFNVVRVLAAGMIVLSCFLIMNTLTTLIAEQMRMIGIMKALGGTRQDILKGYALTVLIYSVLGTLAGLVLGIAIAYTGAWIFMNNLKHIFLGPFSIPPNVFFMAIGAGIGAPCITALFTILNGTRITAREALGAYGVTSVSASPNPWLSTLTERLLWIPQTVWLGFRGIFRKRGRAILTIGALALSGVTFLAVTIFTFSLNQRVMELRTNFAYDVSVSPIDASSNDPVVFPRTFPQLYQMLHGIPNVARVEQGNEVTIIDTSWGTLTLEGVDVDTQVYSKPIIAGRWFRPGEQNVLLMSEHMLQIAHLSIGNTITLADGNGHSAAWKIIGAVDDKPNHIVTDEVAITSVENVNRFSGTPIGGVNTLYIQARDHSPDALQQLTNRIDQVMQTVGNAAPASTKQDELVADERNALSIGIIFYMAAIAVALAGLLSLYNTLTSSVLERQREIGVWRSLGASNWQVARAFWIEGLSLACLAWLIGVLIGLPIAYSFISLASQWLFPLPFVFDLWSLPLMLLALIAIATLASFGPTARASRARIATILRYE